MTTRGHPRDRLVFSPRRLNTNLASLAQKRVTNLVYELAVAHETLAKIFYSILGVIKNFEYYIEFIWIFRILTQRVSAPSEINYIRRNIFTVKISRKTRKKVSKKNSKKTLRLSNFVILSSKFCRMYNNLQNLQKTPATSNGSLFSFLQFYSDTYSKLQRW